MNPLKEVLRLVASELGSAGHGWALIRCRVAVNGYARTALTLISERGFNRGKDLLGELDSLRGTPDTTPSTDDANDP